jgi:hypothetical protein
MGTYFSLSLSQKQFTTEKTKKMEIIPISNCSSASTNITDEISPPNNSAK